MNLDEALAELEKKEAAMGGAIAEFNAEQAAGRLGLDAYLRQKRLTQELTAFVAAIAAKMDEVVASL